MHNVYDLIINSEKCKEYSLSDETVEETLNNLEKSLNCFTDRKEITKSLDFGSGWGAWAGGCNFDLINCNQVLEHVPNPRATLKLLHDSLSKNGGVWIAVPHCDDRYLDWQQYVISKGNNSKALNPWEHTNYFTPDSLLKMCKAEGLVPHKSFLDENGELITTEGLFVKDSDHNACGYLVSKLRTFIW